MSKTILLNHSNWHFTKENPGIPTAVMGEAMRINDDEFDYVFYSYGMQLFPEKRMPLIESLEYKDVKRIREFVIAIDTSGSVMGEQVQAFLQKTYNILQSTESFFSRINVHIIQ